MSLAPAGDDDGVAARLRWIIFALAAAAFWLSFFHRVAPGAIAGDLTRAFDVSGAALGALAATYFYVYAAMQLPTGVLVDTLGPRRVLAVGGLVAGAGSLIFGAADSVAMAAIGRTLAGLGVSVAFVSMLKLNAGWFEERRFATVSGLGNVIGIAGALAATAPLAWLVTVVSWRSVFVCVGFASIVVAVLTWHYVRDVPAGHHPVPSAAHRQQHWYNGLGEVLRNRATWAGFWVNFGVSGSYMSFIGLWMVPFLVHVHGYTPIAASQHAAVMLLAFAVSVAGVGALSDRLRRRRPLIIGSAALYLACWGAWIAGVPSGSTYVLCGLMGFCVTGFTLSWPCAKEVNPPRYAGMATSLVNTGGFVAAGVLQPLVGGVLDLSTGGAERAYTFADFRVALMVLALFALIGLVGALFIRETRCRNIWSSEIAGKQQ